MSAAKLYRRPGWRFATVLMIAVVCAVSIRIESAMASDFEDPDLLWYAAQYNVTLAEAEQRTQLVAEAGALEAALETAEPEGFGGLFVDHDPEFRIVVLLAGELRASLEDYIAEDLRRYLTVQRADSSLETLMASAGQIRSIEDVVPFDVGVNIRLNRVEIYAVSRAALDSYFADRMRQVPEGVAVIEVLSQIRPAAIDIWAGLTPSSGCSIGYSVQSQFGTKGILSAGHCNNALAYQNVSLIYVNENWSGSNDEQWFRSLSFNYLPRVQKGGTSYLVQSTTNRTNQVVGAPVCKMGKTTGYVCGTIVNKSIAPGYIPNAQPTFIQATANGTDMSSGGDSGGPVFWSSSAYGLVSGENCFITCWDLIYVAINYATSGLGVTVLTG
jgi:hypothetical protein